MEKNKKNHEFVRGDSFCFKIKLLDADKQPIIADKISELFVTFRKYTNDDSPIIFQKNLEDVTIDEYGYCHVAFNPEDTQDLPYGEYYFDMEVTLNSGYRKSRLYEIELTKETTIHRTEGENTWGI